MRRLFARIPVNECNGDISTVIDDLKKTGAGGATSDDRKLLQLDARPVPEHNAKA
jgi:hypothetical protein